jgi:hypothetical protein
MTLTIIRDILFSCGPQRNREKRRTRQTFELWRMMGQSLELHISLSPRTETSVEYEPC